MLQGRPEYDAKKGRNPKIIMVNPPSWTNNANIAGGPNISPSAVQAAAVSAPAHL